MTLRRGRGIPFLKQIYHHLNAINLQMGLLFLYKGTSFLEWLDLDCFTWSPYSLDYS